MALHGFQRNQMKGYGMNVFPPYVRAFLVKMDKGILTSIREKTFFFDYDSSEEYYDDQQSMSFRRNSFF